MDVWVIQNQNTFHVLVTNFALPKHDIKTETITIQLKNISKIKSCHKEVIDDDHANARKEWINMGKPGSLSHQQVQILESKSSLRKELLSFKFENGNVSLQTDILPLATMLITLETE